MPAAIWLLNLFRLHIIITICEWEYEWTCASCYRLPKRNLCAHFVATIYVLPVACIDLFCFLQNSINCTIPRLTWQNLFQLIHWINGQWCSQHWPESEMMFISFFLFLCSCSWETRYLPFMATRMPTIKMKWILRSIICAQTQIKWRKKNAKNGQNARFKWQEKLLNIVLNGQLMWSIDSDKWMDHRHTMCLCINKRAHMVGRSRIVVWINSHFQGFAFHRSIFVSRRRLWTMSLLLALYDAHKSHTKK